MNYGPYDSHEDQSGQLREPNLSLYQMYHSQIQPSTNQRDTGVRAPPIILQKQPNSTSVGGMSLIQNLDRFSMADEPQSTTTVKLRPITERGNQQSRLTHVKTSSQNKLLGATSSSYDSGAYLPLFGIQKQPVVQNYQVQPLQMKPESQTHYTNQPSRTNHVSSLNTSSLSYFGLTSLRQKDISELIVSDRGAPQNTRTRSVQKLARHTATVGQKRLSESRPNLLPAESSGGASLLQEPSNQRDKQADADKTSEYSWIQRWQNKKANKQSISDIIPGLNGEIGSEILAFKEQSQMQSHVSTSVFQKKSIFGQAGVNDNEVRQGGKISRSSTAFDTHGPKEEKEQLYTDYVSVKKNLRNKKISRIQQQQLAQEHQASQAFDQNKLYKLKLRYSPSHAKMENINKTEVDHFWAEEDKALQKQKLEEIRRPKGLQVQMQDVRPKVQELPQMSEKERMYQRLLKKRELMKPPIHISQISQQLGVQHDLDETPRDQLQPKKQKFTDAEIMAVDIFDVNASDELKNAKLNRMVAQNYKQIMEQVQKHQVLQAQEQAEKFVDNFVEAIRERLRKVRQGQNPDDKKSSAEFKRELFIKACFQKSLLQQAQKSDSANLLKEMVGDLVDSNMMQQLQKFVVGNDETKKDNQEIEPAGEDNQASLQKQKTTEQTFDMKNLTKVQQKAYQIAVQEKFKQIGQNLSKPGTFEKFKHDVQFIYQQALTDEDPAAVLYPLTSKIINDMLILTQYNLQIAHCKALKQVLSHQACQNLQLLHLENCSLKDSTFALILQGANQIDGLRTLTYKNNDFGYESLEALKPILEKSFPKNLYELKLIHCIPSKTTVIDDLLAYIKDEQCSLMTLCLVGVKLSESGINVLTDIVKLTGTLTELDISWNDLRSFQYREFLQGLSKNRALKYLNLSWNNLIDQVDGTKDGNFQIEKKNLADANVKDIIQQNAAPQMDNYPKFVAECLSNFIRHNPKLLHLNLQSCGLNQQVMIDMVKGIKRAKSMIGLHLGGNHGICKDINDFWCKYIKIKPPKAEIHNYNRSGKEDQESLGKFRKKAVQEEKLQLEEVRRQQVYLSMQHAIKDLSAQDMSISRVLGHKQELPGRGQWQMLTQDNSQCWSCNFSQFMLILWSPEIGSILDQTTFQITDQSKQDITAELLTKFSGVIDERPILFSQSNDWKGEAMIPIFEFSEMLGEAKVNLDQVASEKAEELEPNYEDMNFSLKKAITHKLKQQIEGERLQNWVTWIENYYKQRSLPIINKELFDVCSSPATTYVSALILNPGRQQFFISHKDLDTNQTKNYYNRQIMSMRPEQQRVHLLQMKKATIQRVFKKENSVFARWTEDTPKVVQDCLEHDFHFWKVNRLIKDEEEMNQIRELTKKHFFAIKEIYICLLAKSAEYPSIPEVDFNKFCYDCHMIDEFLTFPLLQIQFKAVNVELGDEDQVGNDDRNLCRFELIEIMIRLGKIKFYDSQKVSSVSEAFRQVIMQMIEPQVNKMFQWQKFRNEQLWTLSVNDLMEANLDSLKKLFKKAQGKKKNKLMRDQALVFLTKTCESNLKMTIVQAQQVYALSKVTVPKENDDQTNYYSMDFPEFLEMLARIADMKFLGTPQEFAMTLSEKLEWLFNLLFPMVNATVFRLDIGQLEETESDTEY